MFERIRKLFVNKTPGVNNDTYAVLLETDIGLLAIDPKDDCVSSQLRQNGAYEKKERDLLTSYLNADSKVLVVGTHIGSLAIPLSMKCQELIAIEANPKTFELLTINLLLNNIENVRSLNIAASNKEEEIDFLLSTHNSGGSKRVPLIKDDMYYYDNPEQVKVKAYPLDDFLDDHEFDLVIMDIEGSEFFALGGMQRILKGTKVLAIEFLPHHLRNVSGVSVNEFLSLIEIHFTKLTIPSRNISVDHSEFHHVLQEMYENDEVDSGIIFEN
jgi:FkbM family methyltransferase